VNSGALSERLTKRALEWRVVIEEIFETSRAMLAYGRCDGAPVVLKVVEQGSDEWRSADVLRALRGRGVVDVLEVAGGAMLMERLMPGQSLVDVVLHGNDDEATTAADTRAATTRAVTTEPAGGATAPAVKVLEEGETLTVTAETLTTRGFQVACTIGGQRVNFESARGETLRSGDLMSFPDGPELTSKKSGPSTWVITCRRA